jgi:hypothetical protein
VSPSQGCVLNLCSCSAIMNSRSIHLNKSFYNDQSNELCMNKDDSK